MPKPSAKPLPAHSPPPGSDTSRALQLRRAIGLSPTQAASLDRVRNVIFDHLSGKTLGRDGFIGPAEIRRRLSRQRGSLSAPQIAMLTKAFTASMNEADAEALLDRHAKAMRAHRIKVTAGHAAHSATENAKLIGWHIAQFFGAIPPTARRFWRTAGDERVRHSHSAVPRMNPAGVPLSEPFNTPFGRVMAPPLEINCRCRATLQVRR